MARHHNQYPDLNFEDWEQVRAEAATRAARPIPKGVSPQSRAMRERARESDRRTAAMAADAPRTRFRAGRPALVRTGRDGEAVRARAGVVEMANLPGTDFDYRVSFRVPTDGRPRLEADAVTVIARADGPPVTVEALRGARVGEAVNRAARVLTRRGEGRRRAGESDARGLITKDSESPLGERTSGAQVSDEVRAAAELYRAARAEGKPTTAYIAHGLEVSADVARKRVQRARVVGLLPKVKTTRP